jgi:hypothetical protein
MKISVELLLIFMTFILYILSILREEIFYHPKIDVVIKFILIGMIIISVCFVI